MGGNILRQWRVSRLLCSGPLVAGVEEAGSMVGGRRIGPLPCRGGRGVGLKALSSQKTW